MYGLQRIMQIDTFVSGLEMCLEMDDHTLITGANGAGKSSTMRLLAFFFGANPNDLDNQAKNRASFTDFYLPRSTSLLVFEYRRESGLCCVVVYRHRSGTKHVYRFLSAGFERDQFTKNTASGEVVFLQGHELSRHWASMGLAYSCQIENVIDYRAIIQNDRKALTRKRGGDSQVLATQYNLGSSKTRMRHMERVCWAIASQALNLNKLGEILADIMEQEHVKPPSNPISPKDLAVADDVRSMRRFEQQEPLVRGILSEYEEREGLEDSLGRHAGGVQRALAGVEAALDEVDQDLGHLRAARDARDEAGEALVRDLNSERIRIKADAEGVGRQINQLDDEKHDYLERGMAEKAADYDQLPHFQREATEASERYVKLTDAVRQEEHQRDQAIRRAEQQFQREKDRIRSKKDEVNAQLADLNQRSVLEQSKIKDVSHEEEKQSRAAADADLEPLRAQRSELTATIRNPAPTQESQAALALADEDLTEARQRLDRIRSGLDSARQKLADSKARRQDAQDRLTVAGERVRRKQAECDKTQDLLYAQSDTLLKALRIHDPDWAGKLGKIIRPEILHRKDLAPVFRGGGSETVFGWAIELGAIELPEHARTEGEIQQSLSRLEAEVNSLRTEQGKCKSQAVEAAAHVEDADRAVREAELAERQAKQHIERCTSSSHAAKTKMQDDRASQREEAELQKKRVEEQIRQCQERLEREIEAATQRKQSAINDLLQKKASDSQQFEESLKRYVRQITDAQAALTKRVRELRADFGLICSEKGVDSATVEAAELARNLAREKVDELRSLGETITRYRDWLDHDWPRREALASQLADLHKQSVQIQSDLEAARADLERDMASFREQQKQLERRQRELRSQREILDTLSRGLSGFVPNEGADEVISADALIEEVTQQTRRYHELGDKLQDGIQKLSGVISEYNNSQIQKAWSLALSDLAQNLGCESVHERRVLLSAPQILESFWRRDLASIRQALIEQSRTVGKGLADLHDQLRSLSSQIKYHARRISRAVEENLYVEAVSSMRFELKPKVGDLEYWGLLADFSASWAAWSLRNYDDLPPEDFLDQMGVLTRMLGAVATETQLANMFDVEIRAEENGRPVRITSDQDLLGASSTGLKYLMVCMLFIALARMLCADRDVLLHWPVDEIGSIDEDNLFKLMDMLKQSNVIMLAAFPMRDPYVLARFTRRYRMDLRKGLITLDSDYLTLQERSRLDDERQQEVAGG